MSNSSSSKATLQQRKDDVRRRLAISRARVIRASDPLRHPWSLVGQMLWGYGRRKNTKAAAGIGTPLWVDVASLVLGLFTRRLGLVGRLARWALIAYPVINKVRRLR